jgi:hypothetical protein
LLLAWLCDKIIHVWNLESHIKIVGHCAPWNVTSRTENVVLQGLQFQRMSVCREFPDGTGVRIDLLSALWRSHLVLVLIAHLNRE